MGASHVHYSRDCMVCYHTYLNTHTLVYVYYKCFKTFFFSQSDIPWFSRGYSSQPHITYVCVWRTVKILYAPSEERARRHCTHCNASDARMHARAAIATSPVHLPTTKIFLIVYLLSIKRHCIWSWLRVRTDTVKLTYSRGSVAPAFKIRRELKSQCYQLKTYAFFYSLCFYNKFLPNCF